MIYSSKDFILWLFSLKSIVACCAFAALFSSSLLSLVVISVGEKEEKREKERKRERL